MGQIYSIPEFNFQTLCQRLEKLTRRAVRLGRTVPVLTKVGERTEVVDQKKGLLRTYFDVMIESEPVCVNGWTFVATIELGDSEVGLVINRVPDVFPDTGIPLEFRKTTNYCSHCNKNVRRNNVYVVRHNVTGEWKQIGRQCLGQFLGGVDPEDVVRYMESTINFDALCSGASDPNFFGFRSRVETLDLMQTLVFTGFAIDKLGWLSRSKSRELSQNGENKRATADYIESAYFTPEKDQDYKTKELVQAFDDLTEQDKQKYVENAERAVEWIRSTNDEERSDFLHNLAVTCSHETFNRKHMGIVVSLLVAYNYATAQQEKKNIEKLTSNYVGVVGSKLTFQAKVVNLVETQSQWGQKTGVMFVDQQGNKLLWWASKVVDVQVGMNYEVTAKVKRHSEYKSVKQTEISHSKIARPIG